MHEGPHPDEGPLRQADAVALGHRRFVDTVEHLTDSFTEIDGSWTITYMNRTGLRWAGLDRDQVIGRDFWSVFPYADGSPFAEMLRRVMATRAAELAETPSARTGRWFESNVFPSGDGIAVLSRDINARKQADAALRVADRRKDEFIATLGHELRNPLAPIRTAAQVLRRLEPADGPAARAIDIIERQVEQLTRLVDDLLDVSRITRGQVELRRHTVDFAAIVEQALEATGPIIEARRHRVERRLADAPLPVHVDPARLAQVLSNLLHNAAKYTPEGGVIEVRADRDDDRLVAEVRDSGQGLAEEDRERIFDLFTQIDRAHGSGGLGVGLTVARELVQRHGGTLAVHSDGPGLGAVFTVMLPLASTPVAPPAAMTASVTVPAPPRRILVVDDNADAVEAMSVALRMAGHDVRTAGSGGVALDLARRFRPDAVLLDIGLPGMSGYDVARALRADPDLADVLLVAVTGWGQPEDLRKAREAGFDHHQVKPVDIAQIEVLLARR